MQWFIEGVMGFWVRKKMDWDERYHPYVDENRYSASTGVWSRLSFCRQAAEIERIMEPPEIGGWETWRISLTQEEFKSCCISEM